MSQFTLGPVPYQMRMTGDMMVKVSEDYHTYDFSEDKENIAPSPGLKKIAFPTTKAVLWNRNPIASSSKLSVLENSSSVKLVVNERTLQLAYKQLDVIGEDFNGFCIGELQIQGCKMSIVIDRFDPGRDGHINSNTHTECGAQKIRIPTTSIPGNLNIPIQLCNGMAFVDHVTTQTHTEEEFFKEMKVLESWCSRKDKLDVNNLFSSKLKCCFQENNGEIFTYITCGLLFINEEFTLIPINPIPIIPTALARNLEGPVSLSDVQGHVKTGFVTMDQSRKLLLLLETDPLAYSLPLVGVWISGVEDINSAEVWACCTRFIHNRNMEEKVYAPPNNYLLLIYSTKSAFVIFREFSHSRRNSNVNFQFLSCCEGIAMSKTDAPSADEEYSFDLVDASTGTSMKTFRKALNKINHNGNGYVEEIQDTKQFELQSRSTHDDSIPLDCPTPSPHPQIQMGTHRSFPSVPDLSICESFVVEPSVCHNETNVNSDSSQRNMTNLQSKTVGCSKLVEPAVTKLMAATKKLSNKHPRHNKASLARMDVNKQVRDVKKASSNFPKKANLAISFNNPKKKEKEMEEDNEQNNTDEDVNIHNTVEMMEEDEATLKLPVKIRQRSEVLLSPNSSYIVENQNNNEESDKIRECNGDIALGNLQPQPYCPEYYSDASVEDSFIFNSYKDSSEDPVGPGENLMKKTSSEEAMVIDEIDITKGDKVALNEVTDKDAEEEDEDADINKKTKDELYDLVLTQQEQLSNLQAQLELFLKHQNMQQEEKKLNEERKEMEKEEKEKSESAVSSEISSLQEMQRVQLNALQLQVKEFLESSKSPDKKDTSSQCSIVEEVVVVHPTFQSVAVNTGESLFWPNLDTSSNNSDVPCGSGCGCGHNDRVGGGLKCAERRQHLYHHCHKAKNNKDRCKKEDSSMTSNGYSGIVQVSSPSLSDICTEDIASSIFEDTANSSQSISSSLKEVDMPVYDESQDAFASPVLQTKDKRDWNTSPVLGESASMLSEEEHNRRDDIRENLKEKEREDMNPINDAINNEEFYSQVMCQVQKLIEAQNISISSTNDNTSTVVDSESSKADVTTSTEDPEDDLQHVRDVTVKQLNEIINQSCESESGNPKLVMEQKECIPTGILSTLPRINYMSMAVDETLIEEPSFNEIAAKYLPNEYLNDELTEICNKTVKFQGVFKELNTPSRNVNMTSINFSCNMSIATKKYLQRYELIDGEKLPTQPLADVNGRVSRKVKHSNSSRSYSESDKENILDFKKLRSLPKLL